MNIIRINTTPSTNISLKELATGQSLEEGTVLVTHEQTAGRGQAGKSWESEPGKNLTFSMIFYPSFLPVSQNFLLSMVVALGMKDVLDTLVDSVSIKWPNDVFYKDKKLVGTLIENDITGTSISQSIAGIGLNVNQEAFKSDAPNPVSLKTILGADLDLDELLDKIIDRILSRYEELKEEKIDTLVEDYHKALYWKAGFHSFCDKNGEFKARIELVGHDGYLHLVTEEGEERQYAFKEVTYLI